MLDIVGKRAWYFLFSALIILPGLVSLMMPSGWLSGDSGLNTGIDFASGSVLSVTFDLEVTEDQIQERMKELGHGGSIINTSSISGLKGNFGQTNLPRVDSTLPFERIKVAKSAGIKDENIILDPGIGFGKTVEHNLILLQRLNEFSDLGFPLLIGTSKKSFIGKISDLPAEERLEGTIASNVLAVMMGAKIVRVHDVLEHKRALEIIDAIESA